MSNTTNISWADHTASPWYGCTEVSEGCANCYAREWGKKRDIVWGRGQLRVKSKSFESNVRKWNKHDIGWPPRVFPSLCDPFDIGSGEWGRGMDVPREWRRDFLRVVHDTPNLNWLLLTKRPEAVLDELRGVADDLPGEPFRDWLTQWLAGNPPSNVWPGTTVENDRVMRERIGELIQIPARVRWLSVEPLLEPICLPFIGTAPKPCPYVPIGNMIHWVVVGGESGPRRRDCGVEAIVSIAEQCLEAGVPVWVKQDCARLPGQQGRIPDDIWKLKQLPCVNPKNS